MEIDIKLVNRYLSISGDKVSDDRRGLVARARLKLAEDNSLPSWKRRRLRAFIEDLKPK